MSRLDDMVKRHPLPTGRGLAWLVMLLLAVLLGWSYVARLEEVAVATGEVVPRGQVKVIQHLEGGSIRQIYVAEGQDVQAGDRLVQLTLAPSGLNREELQVRLDGLVLNRARLAAEARGGSLKFPKAEAGRQPEILRGERQAFEADRRQLDSMLVVLEEQVRQRALDIKELEAKRKTVTADTGLAGERFAMSESLLEEGLTSKMEHVQLKREMEALRGELARLETAIPRSKAALAEARGRIKDERLRRRREANDELAKVEALVARTRELFVKAADQVDRTEIVSPIDGVVKNLRYHTIGGVVRPGESIMEIVPSGDMLVVEARLDPIDRGYVAEGQVALVKVSSYDFVRYGGLDGKVVHVAADANTDPDGAPYYRVIVETSKAYLGEMEGDLPITSGMQATIDIHTGDKSVMEYMLRPMLKLKYEAFRER